MIGGSILKWFFYKPPRKCLDVAKLYYPDIFVLKKNRFLWYVQFTFNLQASEVGRGYFTTITITRLGRLQQVAFKNPNHKQPLSRRGPGTHTLWKLCPVWFHVVTKVLYRDFLYIDIRAENNSLVQIPHSLLMIVCIVH